MGRKQILQGEKAAWFAPPPLYAPDKSWNLQFLKSGFVLNFMIIEKVPGLYSVMQSDRNRFYGEFVLDSVNMAFRDEDNIFYQI